ncbi:PGC-1 and ERR-induced regulator in muscle protein 1 [Anolis carolinensis]
MENFEYSIWLNDRDWAEFYLASEECSLIPPALATADEPLLSDLEEGELEPIRWGAVPAHDTTNCLSRRAPDAHLLAEDLLSGSEDETDLGSVSRFLCHDNTSNTVLSSWTQGSPLSSVTLKHLGHQLGMATPTENEGDSEMGNLPNNSDCSSPIQERLGKETMESQDVSVGMDDTARENGPETISLQLQTSQNDALQMSSADNQLSTSTNVAENSEDEFPIIHPCSPDVSSPLLTEPEGTTDAEKSSKDLQIVSMAQPTPFHENLFQGYSDIANWASESHIEGPQEWASNVGEDALNSKGEKETEYCDNSKERDQVGQASSSPYNNAALFPEGSEGSKYRRPTQELDETLARRRKSGASTIKDNGSGLGMAESFEKESHPTIQRGHGSDFRKEFEPFCLTSQDSPETQESTGNMWDGREKEGPVSYPATELPSMYGPEMYEYFFDKMDETQRDKDTTPKPFLLSGHQSTPSDVTNSAEAGDAIQISIPEVYEYFFDNSAKGKRNWRGILLSFPASEARKAARALKALIGRHMRRVKPQTRNYGELLRRGSQGTLVLFSPALLTEAQARPEDLHMAVMEPERPLQPVLTHRDMCLGFVAFASWAVKTSDLQAPDAWKIVLLANFGTLSAIRYFRRQVIIEGQHAT